MFDVALLIMRLITGSLMAGHGAQKLFGAFKGPGLKGTSGFMESLGMRPGKFWGPMAAVGEFSGGVLTALGLLSPIGPQNIMGAMATATRRAHWRLPVWASQRGAELPLTNFAVALTLAVAGPGRYSLDRLFGIRLPKWFVALTWANHVLFVLTALFRPEAVQMVLDGIGLGPLVQSAPAAEPVSHLEVEKRPRTDAVEAAEQAVES